MSTFYVHLFGLLHGYFAALFSLAAQLFRVGNQRSIDFDPVALFQLRHPALPDGYKYPDFVLRQVNVITAKFKDAGGR